MAEERHSRHALLCAKRLVSGLLWCLLVVPQCDGQQQTAALSITGINCSFTPVHNQTFVERVYRHFDEDSDVKVVEYVINFNVTPPFDWSRYSDPDSFQPWRWFRTQGSGSTRLLLAFYYYYGIFKNYLTFDTRKITVTLNLEPEGCLENIGKGQLEALLRDYLLRDFDINPKTVKHPYTVSDDVSVCSMHLDDVDGWGRLTYRCCGYDNDDDNNDATTRTECHDVFNDGWVWTLRSLVITFTIVLFLYLPSFIPGRHRIRTYDYSPPDDTTFDLVMTSHPDKYTQRRNATVLRTQEWQKMANFKQEVDKLEADVMYNARVQSVSCCVSGDRIAYKHHSPISFGRSCFDAFVLCKIRHKTPVEECCHTSVCGELCCGGMCCPPWHSWLRAARVIVIMTILALPSLPLFYAMAADGLGYQELDKAQEERGLFRTFNFYPGKIAGRVFVGFMACMYVVNAAILVVDGATDGRLLKLYSSVLEVSEEKSAVRNRVRNLRYILKKALRPLQRYGFYLLPIWLVGVVVLLPIALVILFVVTSPMAKILTHAVTRLLRRMNVISQTDVEADERMVTFCKMFWFLISLVFVFIVLTFGINLLIHVMAMIIVEFVADARIVYQVLPNVLFLLFYIRDAFFKVGDQYQRYLQTIIESLASKADEEMRRETRKPWPLEQNKMFHISKPDNTDEDHLKGADATVVVPQTPSTTSLFEEYNEGLWIRLRRVVLLMSKDEVVTMSKRFFFRTCTMECFGTPGRLEENFIKASINFLKIAVFLLFVFIAVMAYGSIYDISPTNHLFITLVSGLAPLVLRNLFPSKEEDPKTEAGSFRYESQLDQKVQDFVESWELHDLVLESAHPKINDSEATNEPLGTNLTSSRMASYRQPSNKVITSTLILDTSQGAANPSTHKNRPRPRSLNRQTSRPVSNKRSRIGSANICCGANEEEDSSKSPAERNKKAPTDDVNVNQSSMKNRDTSYRTEDETDSRRGPVCNQDKTGRDYELSNMDPNKRKGKTNALPGLKISGPDASHVNHHGDPSHQPAANARSQTYADEEPQQLKKSGKHRKKRSSSTEDYHRFVEVPPSLSGGGQGHSSYGREEWS